MEVPARLPALLPSWDVDTHVPQPTAQLLSHLGTMLADGTRAALSQAGVMALPGHRASSIFWPQFCRWTCVRGAGTTAQSQQGLGGVGGVWE